MPSNKNIVIGDSTETTWEITPPIDEAHMFPEGTKVTSHYEDDRVFGSTSPTTLETMTPSVLHEFLRKHNFNDKEEYRREYEFFWEVIDQISLPFEEQEGTTTMWNDNYNRQSTWNLGDDVGKKNKNNNAPYTGYQGQATFKSKQCPTHTGTKTIWTITNEKGEVTELAGAQGSHVTIDDELSLVIDLAGMFKKPAGDPIKFSGFTKSTDESDPEVAWGKDMSDLKDYVHFPSVLRIENPDMGIPPVGYKFWSRLAELLPIGRVVCCCVGGHGRTGTALAALMIATDPNISAADAIKNVRELHCKNAIESATQESYLERLVKEREVSLNQTKG